MRNSPGGQRFQTVDLVNPWQSYRGVCKRDEPLATARESERFAGRRLHRHTVGADLGNFRDARAHGITMGSNAWRLAYNRYIEMCDASATGSHALNGKRKTDKLDARALCQRLSRWLDGNRDELTPIRIPSEAEQHRREGTRRRKFLGRLIRMLANCGHGQGAEYAHVQLPARWWGARNWKKLAALDPHPHAAQRRQ